MIHRLNKRIGTPQFFKNNKSVSDPNSPHYISDYRVYKGILKDFFQAISKRIVEDGFDYKIPHGLGRLHMRKWRPGRKKRAIDWYNTKKYGKTIYHNNTHSAGFAAKWKWDKYRTLAKGIRLYLFTPTRTNHRAIAKAIKDRNSIMEYRMF